MIAAVRGEPSFFNGGGPIVEFAGIAGIGAADLRDGGDAQSDHVAFCFGRVALEIALQRAFDLRTRELIVDLGEVIHADVAVAVGGEALDGIKHDVHLRHCIGQIGGQNSALGLEVVGQMRVVVERNAVGREFKHLVDRLRKGFAGLLRQTVDQIHVDGVEPLGAGCIHRFLCHFKGLNAVDRLLHIGIEVLDAERHAVQTNFTELFHLRGTAGTRIDLNGEFAARFSEREALRERVHHEFELILGEKRRGAAAEVQLFELLRPRQVRLHQIGFLTD